MRLLSRQAQVVDYDTGGRLVRCTRVRFQGWRRLADVDCDVTPRLLAFVGENEAGKSSFLQGLEWLTEAEQTAATSVDKSRANRPTDGWMIGAHYALEPDDVAALEPLGLEEVPSGGAVWKQVDGSLVVSFLEPAKLGRARAPFVQSHEALKRVADRLATDLVDAAADIEEEGEVPGDWVVALLDVLADPDHDWTKLELKTATRLADWLSVNPEGETTARDAEAARLLVDASEIARRVHPAEAARDILLARMPRFVQFGEQDRLLPTLTPATAQGRMRLGPAAQRIYDIGGISPEELWRAHRDGDTGEVASLREAANKRLAEFFGQAWNQSNIAVSVDTHADGLLVHTYEIDTGRHTRMEERSDGLRTFIALAAFLESQNLEHPPVLLIDEAETHLHLNAQADLVSVLLRQVRAAKVLYTTHSPGCLPSDLGTGVRLVQKVDDRTSVIKSHFWTNEAPGFDPLLFAMGAGAAAFSMCRRAVLAEGAADMVLLPTLLRLANGVDDLGYQIAPGLANARAFGMKVEEVAARVMYLTDGDGAGERYRGDLSRLADVEETRILSLPVGMASEDLLEPAFLLDIVKGLLPKSAPMPTMSCVSGAEPIMKELNDWAERQTPALRLPGKVAVAYAVIESPRIALDPDGERVLTELHEQFVRGFGLD